MNTFKVVIPSCTDENVIECVRALRLREPRLGPSDIIVVDDGAYTPRSRDLPVTWVQGVKPFIFARNVNIGIRAANDNVIVENDDTRLLTTNGLSTLAAVSNHFCRYGVISPSLTASWNPDLKWDKRALLEVKNEYLSFVCPYIPKHVQNLIGLLDERYDGYGRDDVDYCRRVLLAKMRLGVWGGVKVEHMVMPSSFRDKVSEKQHEAMNERAEAIFDNKWSSYRAPTRDVIQSLWVGDKVSSMEELSMLSFLSHGHPFHLYTYGHVQGVPEGVVFKDAEEIVPHEDIAKFQNLANFSDLFRYNLIDKRGGWWVDLDTVCLRPFDSFPDPIVVAEEGWTKGLCVPSSPFRSNPGSTFTKELVKRARAVDWENMSYCDLGPHLMTKVVQDLGIPYQGAKIFNPIPVGHFDRLIDKHGFDFSENSYAVHLHHATWTHFNGMDVDAEYHHDCVYEWLKRRYEVRHPREFKPEIQTVFNSGPAPPATLPSPPPEPGALVLRDGRFVQLDTKGRPM